MTCTPDSPQSDAFTAPLKIPAGRIELRVDVDFERLRCGYRIGAGAWTWLPEVFDASILSDEATAPGAPNFTGAFVGLACQDVSGMAHPADFDYFEYREREYLRTPE
jgi:xylan 1,4-beta-xylosidase